MGSRYFVTSRNAGRLFFLAPHAVTFLQMLSNTKQLNGLEIDVLHNLTSETDLALLKVDGLLFDQIYADLMCILKSKILNKTYLDMNAHYLELLQHLELLSDHPRLVLDHTVQVFKSEERIYGSMMKLTHRLHKNYTHVRARLYTEDRYDNTLTFPLLKTAVETMAQKLRVYKADQLPGGKMWNPPDDVRKAVEELEATNDVTESILGLNDRLQKAVPNLAQRKVSTLVEVAKNSTIPWFRTQTKAQGDRIITLVWQQSAGMKKRNRVAEMKVKNRKSSNEREHCNYFHITRSVRQYSKCHQQTKGDI